MVDKQAPSSNLTVDWPQIIFDPTFMARMDAMAAKRFVQPVVAQEAATAMLEALAENDWQRLRCFSGKSQPSTFAYTVASRAMEDFARQKFGRPRPPSWLQELGSGWVKVWYMLCLERQWPELIKQKLADDFQEGWLERAMSTIKQRLPRCGEPGFGEMCVSELGLEEFPDDQGHSFDAGLEEAQRSSALALLCELLSHRDEAVGGACPSNADMEGATLFETLREKMALSDDDRLWLTLSYEDGLSSRKIAELVGASAATVQRRLNVIRSELADALAALGLAASEVNV
jgi:RNA polymerase sigma factor (sigma-70 family)